MSSWASVAGSWGCFAGVVILGWYYYTKDGGQPKRISRQKPNTTLEAVLDDVVNPKDQKKTKARKKAKKNNSAETNPNSSTMESMASGSLPQDGKPQSTLKPNQQAVSTGISVSNDGPSMESDVNVKEFARQMAKAQTGTTFSGTKQEGKRIRTQKQSKVNDSPIMKATNGEMHASGSSSNTGADADDDLSSVNSLALSNAASPDPTGIADMLETPGPGASTLRITESLIPSKPQQKHVKKEQVVETKKQRQNRLRREREKEVNREAEAQRKILEERQRRTAREAEGRPAKNGNGWTYDSGLPANAWSAGKAPAKPAPTTTGDLLDTTEESVKLPTIIDNVRAEPSSKANGINGVKGVNGNKPNGSANTATNRVLADWEHDLPSEEEQFRLIQEQSEESEWTTVSQPKRGKRTKSNTESLSAKSPETKHQSSFPPGFQTDVME